MNIIFVSIYFFLTLCFATSGTLCPDTTTDCTNSSGLCDVALIKAVCPTTCEVYNTTCLSTESCEVFDFLGLIAFVGYGIVLFLLIIIWILAYSLCVDDKPLRKSLHRLSRKKAKRGHVDNAKNMSGESELIIVNPNFFPSQTVSDPVRDILNSSNASRRGDRLKYSNVSSQPWNDLEEKQGLACPHPLSKSGDYVEDEAEGHFDDNDEFFRHHALLSAATSELEPPLPPRIGGPRLSGKLSQKFEAQRLAEEESARKNQNLLPRKASSRESLSVPSDPGARQSSPRVANYKQMVAMKLSLDSAPNSMNRWVGGEPSQSGNDPGSKKLGGEPSIPETLSPKDGYAVEAGGQGSGTIFPAAPIPHQKGAPPKYKSIKKDQMDVIFLEKPAPSPSVESIDAGERKENAS